jgi:hypothetical protein
LLQAAVIYTPLLQRTFSTVGLSLRDWLGCASVGSSVLWLREFSKTFKRGKGLNSRSDPFPPMGRGNGAGALNSRSDRLRK